MIAIADRLAELLREHGLDLLLGSTLVLASFALMVALSRSLAGKHRLAGTAIVAVAAYALFAIVPLPRFAFPADESTAPPALTVTASAPPVAPGSNDARPTAALPTPVILPVAPAEAMVTAEQGASGSLPVLAMSSAEAAPASSLTDWLAWLLILGAGLFTAQLLVGWLRLRRILQRSTPAPDALAELAQLPARGRLRITRASIQPFCCGLLRGTIVLPAKMAQTTPATRFVLLHESAHLRSGDARLRAIAALLRPVLFWHPLFWWLQHQLRFTGELLADDAAAQGSVGAYVRCMMTLAAGPTPSATGPLVATVFRRRSELFRRLEMMLQRNASLSHSPSPWQRRLRAASAVALVTLSAGAFGVERAVAQDPVRSERLRAEVAELRATIRQLRAELAVLSKQARAPQPGAELGLTDVSAGGGSGLAGVAAGARNAPDLIGIGGGAGGGRPTGFPPNSTYRVGKGDTFAGIAKQLYGSNKSGVDRLRRLNPDVDPRRLRVGQKLKVSAPNSRLGGAMGAAPRAATQPTPSLPQAAPSRLPGAPATQGLPNPPRAAISPAAPRPSRPLRASAAPNQPATPSELSSMANLVTRMIELRGEVEICEVELEYAEAAAKSGTGGTREAAIAKIRLRTKMKQFEAIHRMLEAELAQAEAKLSHSKKLYEQGFISQSEIRADESRVQMLHRVLH